MARDDFPRLHQVQPDGTATQGATTEAPVALSDTFDAPPHQLTQVLCEIAIAEGMDAKLQALRDGAAALAVPAYLGLLFTSRAVKLHRPDVLDRLLAEAKDVGLTEAFGQATIEQAIAESLVNNPELPEPPAPPSDNVYELHRRDNVVDLRPPAPKPILTLDEWLNRKLPQPDFLLGSWLSATSRVLINAPTGIGKTMFGIALAIAIAGGLGFLHWRGIRLARVLFIDGEMSRRLLLDRLADEVKRIGGIRPTGMHILSHEDVIGFAPLNTKEGQGFIERIIKDIGGVDLIVFDNIMSLVAGDMKEEGGWAHVLPWIRSLTRRNVGQLWLHHTGHDESRGYGTKTREWQMDTVAHFEEVKRPDTDVSFQIAFPKARERRPENRAEFADTRIALVNDEWTSQPVSGGGKAKKVPALAEKFFNALANATIGSTAAKMFSRPTATIEEWRTECFKLGLLDRDKDHSARTLFARHKRELIAANWIACNETVAWTLP
jgi:hypothetical protein